MDNNNPLQNNVNNIHDGFIDNGGFNSYSSNLPPTNLNTSYNFSAMGDNTSATNNYEQQPMFSFMNNQDATSTMQSYPMSSQYTDDYNVNSSPLNFPQENGNPEIFRFEIPGFKVEIFVTPTTSITTNLNMQNQFQQQGHTFSNVITDNSQTQFQQQQQNSLDVNESFINFNN